MIKDWLNPDSKMNRLKQTILILERDEGLKESLKLILETDYYFLSTDDIDEIQKYLTVHGINLFIIDVNGLPNALSALKQVKTLYPDLKILLLSTHFELPFQEAAVKIGHGIRFQEKPFDPRDFKERIDALIRGYSLKRHKYIVKIKNKK